MDLGGRGEARQSQRRCYARQRRRHHRESARIHGGVGGERDAGRTRRLVVTMMQVDTVLFHVRDSAGLVARESQCRASKPELTDDSQNGCDYAQPPKRSLGNATTTCHCDLS